jgi:hypothetical protein
MSYLSDALLLLWNLTADPYCTENQISVQYLVQQSQAMKRTFFIRSDQSAA